MSKDLKEGDRTCNNEIFKHLIRASSLTKIVGLDKQRAIDFLIELKESCKHLSYYWIQLGIIVLSPDLKESSKYTQSLNSSILSQSSKDFLEMRIA